jgi:type IV pilus assembly protein PilO
MANFGEMSGVKQWGAVLGGALVLTGALYFTTFKGMQEKNETAQKALDAKTAENAQLELYRPKLAEMERQLANLKQQLEIERRIVPDDKEADQFMRMVNTEAVKAGIEVRRYTAKPISSKDFYTEIPFDLEIDGPYFGVMNFFDRMAKMERIVNVSNLLVSTTKKPSDAKVKKTYRYAPGESVVATCTATTFFSHDIQPSAVTTAKGATAGVVKR